ncbi:MAG: hypothetical protein WC369_09450 [Dehalococcoidales bacterium]|jgi:hypothetical protein
MKQVFGDEDRIKKAARVPAKKPGTQAKTGSSVDLTETIKASLADGLLPCATAFEISKKLKVPLVTVGNTADDMGIRVVDCQLGFFKVDKAASEPDEKTERPDISEALESLIAAGPLTCAGVFSLAKHLKVRPIEIADAANQRQAKIRHCQLGCF